jgi:septal ring factor EnvC (AmiA/AmiB activator)
MRVRTDDLFRAAEALRKRIEELELHVRVMDHALKLANNDNVALAKRIKYLEGRIEALKITE